MSDTGALKLIEAGAKALAGAVADMIVPPSCPSCAAPLAAQDGLCPSCWSGLRLITPPLCRISGQPFPQGGSAGLVHPSALDDPPPWAEARAAAVFEGTARHLVHRLKYADRQEVAPVMARLMAGAGQQLIAGAEFIVPVPLHPFRLWRRRFNQAGLLAHHISRMAERRAALRSDLLRRVKATARQVGLDAAARRRNLASAFAVPERQRAAVAGRRVVLIDDVLTTGATLRAAVHALRAAGAARVDVLVFALVLAGEDPHISDE